MSGDESMLILIGIIMRTNLFIVVKALDGLSVADDIEESTEELKKKIRQLTARAEKAEESNAKATAKAEEATARAEKAEAKLTQALQEVEDKLQPSNKRK